MSVEAAPMETKTLPPLDLDVVQWSDDRLFATVTKSIDQHKEAVGQRREQIGRFIAHLNFQIDERFVIIAQG